MITYVEPQARYEDIIAGLEGRVFIPNLTQERRLLAVADAQGEDLRERLIPFKTVDTEIDDYLYETSLELAGYVIGSVRGVCAAQGDADHYVPRSCARAAQVALHDRIVSQLRAPVALARLMPDDLRVIQRPGSSADLLEPYLAPRSFTLVNQHPRRPRANPRKIRKLPAFDYGAIRGEILVVTNLKDRQYRDGILPVIERLSAYSPVIATTYPPSVDAPALQKAPQGVLDLSDIPRSTEFMASLMKRAAKWFSLHPDPAVVNLGPYLVEHLRTTIMGFLVYIREFVLGMRPVIRDLRGVVLLPGRYLDGGLAAGLAREARVPTFEIQSGTIAPTRRFVAPAVDHILAMDPCSRRIYVDFQGVPETKVHIVGSPRMDLDLAPVRTMGQAEARQAIGLDEDRYVVLMAGQPVGTQRMAVIADIVIQAVSRIEGAWLVIKQHPGESEQYAEMYRRLARKARFRRMTITTEAPAPACIIAADAVCTFYSTVGLEAFCLGRQVYAVNPFPEPLPFGLADLGVAREVVTADELLEAFYAWDVSPDPELEKLRDGQATARCARFIEERLRRRGPIEAVRRRLRARAGKA